MKFKKSGKENAYNGKVFIRKTTTKKRLNFCGVNMSDRCKEGGPDSAIVADGHETKLDPVSTD